MYLPTQFFVSHDLNSFLIFLFVIIVYNLFVYFLFQECQSLIEDNRRLIGVRNSQDIQSNEYHTATVETVVLQTKIDTLQWQLKQVTKQYLTHYHFLYYNKCSMC